METEGKAQSTNALLFCGCSVATVADAADLTVEPVTFSQVLTLVLADALDRLARNLTVELEELIGD